MSNNTTSHQRRRDLCSKLPAAAMRVFALDGKHYNGCGFHYSLVKTIGGLMYRLNNFDAKYTNDDLLVDEVIYEDLIEQLDDIDGRLSIKT
jgi:hypothetical protein